MKPPSFNVTVFASSTKVDSVYFDAAHELGRAVANRGWGLVYGGNAAGPMGAVADACRDAGGYVTGVSPSLFGDIMDKRCNEFVVAEDMRHRKAEMERRGQAFVTLPGGIGTLEEFFEILVGRHLATHDKPVILANVNGYYDPLVQWLRLGTEQKFVRPAVWEQLHVADTIGAAVSLLERNAGNFADPSVSNASP